LVGSRIASGTPRSVVWRSLDKDRDLRASNWRTTHFVDVAELANAGQGIETIGVDIPGVDSSAALSKNLGPHRLLIPRGIVG
jgi:hypothetical protein